MKPLTLTESFDHLEFACRAVVLICAGFVMGFLIEYCVSDREVSDIDEFTAANGQLTTVGV